MGTTLCAEKQLETFGDDIDSQAFLEEEAVQQPVEIPTPIKTVDEPVVAISVPIRIVSARGLRNADSAPGQGVSDPYAKCWIQNKPASLVKTKWLKDTLDPVWNFSGELQDYLPGQDTVIFEVWDKDPNPKRDDFLGRLELGPEVLFPDGFFGRALLEDTGQGKKRKNKSAGDPLRTFLQVAVGNAAGLLPRNTVGVTEFTIHVTLEEESGPLGLDLDTLDETILRVSAVRPGLVSEYNETARRDLGTDRELRVGDYIWGVDGMVGSSQQLEEQLQTLRTHAITVRRPLPEWRVVCAARWRDSPPVGLDLNYLEESTSLLIRSVDDDGVVQIWNNQAEANGECDKMARPGDRIVAVNGVSGAATRLLAKMKAVSSPSSNEKLILTLERPAPPSPSQEPLDVSALWKLSRDDLGLLYQPEDPLFKVGIIEVYSRTSEFGGDDKSANGHRYDTIPIANGMINAGMSCQLIHYLIEDHEKFLMICKQMDALIIRCSPSRAEEDQAEQAKLGEALRGLRKQGYQIWPSPDVVDSFRSKDAVVKLATLDISWVLDDTFSYATSEDFELGIKASVAFRPRVLTTRRSSYGEGVWIVALKFEDYYCATMGERTVHESEILRVTELSTGITEEHSVAEFLEFFINGKTKKAGRWATKSAGKVLDCAGEAGGQLVDQRFCGKIDWELCVTIVSDEVISIARKVVRDEDVDYEFYAPEERQFVYLAGLLRCSFDKFMEALVGPNEPLPLLWTASFINAASSSEPGEEHWIVNELNCGCVGMSICAQACCSDANPFACWDDVVPRCRATACRAGNLMGQKALQVLQKKRNGSAC